MIVTDIRKDDDGNVRLCYAGVFDRAQADHVIAFLTTVKWITKQATINIVRSNQCDDTLSSVRKTPATSMMKGIRYAKRDIIHLL